MRRGIVAVALAASLLAGCHKKAHADPLVWQTAYGTIGLPFTATETLIGYDALNKESIGGASLPVYTDPKKIVALQVGAVASWPTSGTVVQPYIAAGHDLAREIPGLNQFQALHLNVFGRYVTNAGKAGLGVSAAWSFGS